MYKLSLICPCYQRPKRTIRAIESVLAQEFDSYQAIFIGDNCPDFENNLKNGKFDKYSKEAEKKGNEMIFENLSKHTGGYGYLCRSIGIDMANSEYTIFLDNDDILLPTHFNNYYNFISENKLDWAYSNTFLNPLQKIRQSKIENGMIGHAEIIVKTEILKKLPSESSEYGHDWELINNLVNYKHLKNEAIATYIIMGVGELRETEID
jgi:GT2 family glycosyltransferase